MKELLARGACESEVGTDFLAMVELEDTSPPVDVLGQQEAGIDRCGNGVCYPSELGTCPQDCNYGGYCGDNQCQGREPQNCPSDCNGC